MLLRALRLPGALRVVALLILITACAGPRRPYETVAPQVANLRAQFNDDAGRVRILILPAPN